MSAYSTLRITRETATSLYIKQKIKLEISDAELEDFLDEYLRPRLYNAIIVENYDIDEPNDDHFISRLES